MINSVKVIYGILDQTIADDTATYDFSSATQFTKGNNVMKATDEKSKLMYLENNWIKLDGTRVFPDLSLGYDVGYESEDISDSGGNLSEYIQFNFANTHESYGIKINFGSVAKNFKIDYYKDTTLIGSQEVSDNVDIIYSDNNVRLEWNKVRITITKIAKAYQRARIYSVIFGISDSFEADDLIYIKAGKAVSLKNDNTDSAEAEITFWNSGRFNIETIKDLPVGLQAGLKASVYFDNNYLFNDYIVNSTSVADNGKSITLECYDKIYYLNDTTFGIGKVYPDGRSLYDWAKEVASDAGIEINVDDSFKSIISKGYIGSVSHREALRIIAEAGNGIIKVENGSISLVPFATTSGATITDDDIVEDTLDIQNEEKVLGVKVSQYSFSKKSSQEGLSETTDIALTGSSQTLDIDYSTTPAVASSVSTSSNITIESQVLGVDKAVITFKGTAGETGWITILGYGYSTATATISGGYINSHAKEIDNTLIPDLTLAESVRDFQLARCASSYNYNLEVVSDKNVNLLNNCLVKSYNIIVESINYEIDDDTNSLNITGEDA